MSKLPKNSPTRRVRGQVSAISPPRRKKKIQIDRMNMELAQSKRRSSSASPSSSKGNTTVISRQRAIQLAAAKRLNKKKKRAQKSTQFSSAVSLCGSGSPVPLAAATPMFLPLPIAPPPAMTPPTASGPPTTGMGMPSAPPMPVPPMPTSTTGSNSFSFGGNPNFGAFNAASGTVNDNGSNANAGGQTIDQSHDDRQQNVPNGYLMENVDIDIEMANPPRQ